MKKKQILSLALNILIFVLAVLGTVMMMTGTVSDGTEQLSALGTAALKYFTVDSNLLAGFSAAVSALCLLQVLSGKKKAVPGAADALRLIAVACVSLTALMVLVYLAPEAPEGFGSLYRGPNFLFHCVIPLLAVADQLIRHSAEPLPFSVNFLSPLPMLSYGVWYSYPFLTEAKVSPDRDFYGFFKNGTSGEAATLLLLVMLIVFTLSVIFWCLTRRFDPVAFLVKKRETEKNETGYEAATALEYYQTRVIKLMCIIAPSVAMCAAGIFTSLTLTGRFDMPMLSLIFFDACCIGYIPVAVYVFETCIGEDGIVIASKLTFTKRTLTLLMLVQWNLISYLAPFREFWAYSFLLILLASLFLDRKTLLVNELLIFFSMVLSWNLRGDQLLPVRDGNFLTAMILRFSAILLTCTLLYLVVLLIEKLLLVALDRISDYDPLTHTLTRRKLLRTVETALETYRRLWIPCCVAIFDLDDFKQINDTYGHVKGDEVLKEFGRIMYANIQSQDVIFRYGGEEFLILFHCTPNYAEASCNRILHQLRTHEFPFLPRGERITCTAGIAVSGRDLNARALIALADDRLYAGKRQGKDRVISE